MSVHVLHNIDRWRIEFAIIRVTLYFSFFGCPGTQNKVYGIPRGCGRNSASSIRLSLNYPLVFFFLSIFLSSTWNSILGVQFMHFFFIPSKFYALISYAFCQFTISITAAAGSALFYVNFHVIYDCGCAVFHHFFLTVSKDLSVLRPVSWWWRTVSVSYVIFRNYSTLYKCNSPLTEFSK